MRKTNRIPSAPLADYIKEHNLSAAQMDTILGFKNATHQWLRIGEMPPIVLLALEGLKRRHKQNSERETIMLLRVPKAKRDALAAFLQAFAIENVELP